MGNLSIQITAESPRIQITTESGVTLEVPGVVVGDSGLAITPKLEERHKYVVTHIESGKMIFCEPGVDFDSAVEVCSAAVKVSPNWRSVSDIQGSEVLSSFGRLLHDACGSKVGIMAGRLADLVLAAKREGSEKSL